ncbi:DNA-binding transcriptional regulator, LysR family [Nocardioides alpinus]|uniref:DNA-binding transcriptional regulator, LysR family n=1 Tax=Nocardioides alpinus TaxID=748909 RepID=A0A1I0XWM7_9ACTN|nr:LysR family transcriptional regulator [Nocardioides alpinus]PKH42817.1 LysR family transcriptional regulator [Nocardioides alpinus]SFB05057.1 DNA-binding transcriptional regulator, LysR family [Nocardioides alpinus]
MIDLTRLVFLRAVHRRGSVAAAARELGYTSSAVSQQIGKLQREAGVRLLEPVGRGVVLTDAALVLVDAAVSVEAARDVALGRLEELAGGLTGTLSLACFPSAIRGVAAPALGALAKAAPGLRVRLRELAPELGLDAVTSGYADVAVVHDWVDDRTTLAAGLVAVHLADDPVDLVVPATHRLAGRRTVALAETVDDVWVTDVSDSICTRWILDMLRAATEQPRVDFRAEEYASQVALVSAGLCVAVLPRLGRPALPDTVRVIPLQGSVPTRRFIAVHRAATSRRPAIRRLVEALGEQAARAA